MFYTDFNLMLTLKYPIKIIIFEFVLILIFILAILLILFIICFFKEKEASKIIIEREPERESEPQEEIPKFEIFEEVVRKGTIPREYIEQRQRNQAARILRRERQEVQKKRGILKYPERRFPPPRNW